MTTTIDIALPVMHDKQAAIDKAAVRFNMLNCGRRFGKDVLLERRLIVKMLSQGGRYGWFAPHYRMMQDNYRSIYNRLAPAITGGSKSEHTIELLNGAILDFWSLDNYNVARGRKYNAVTINEAAAAPDLIEAWNNVIRPTLADLRGGADFGSTPRGLNGFYNLWSGAEGKADWARFHYTTYDNPHIPVDEIDVMRESLPARVFDQEILAQFVEDGAFFQGVGAVCVIEQPDDPANHQGHRVLAGLDWAMSVDFSVLTLLCADCGRVVDWWRGNRMDFSIQREFIAQYCRKWGAVCLPERNSIGAPNIEMLMAAGVNIASGPDGALGFNTTAQTKGQLIQRLAVALEQRALFAPVEYAEELTAYEVTLTVGNNAKYGAPSGAHDDRVISLALAWWGAANSISWLVT